MEDMDRIIEKHIAAVGGRPAVEALRSIRVFFHVVEPGFEVDGVYAAERPDRMRVDISMQGVRVFSEGCAGGRGWQLPRDADRAAPASPEGTAALVQGIENHLYGLHELPARGYRLEQVEPGTADGVEYAVIRQTSPAGVETWKWLNPSTWRIERTRQRKALHPDMDPAVTTIETVFSDFRDVDGLVRPFHEVQVDLESGETLQTTTVERVEVNPRLSLDYFDWP